MSGFALQPTAGKDKMNGPGGVTSATPGPNHGDLSEEIAHMADASQYPDSAQSFKPSTVKAIETVYRGHRFRSRLEARWAVFFDGIGLEWEYEPEGFECADGARYLPDFRLHFGLFEVWAEVKGDPLFLKNDHTFLPAWVGNFGALPDRKLLFLGAIPKPAHGLLFVRGYGPLSSRFACDFDPVQSGGVGAAWLMFESLPVAGAGLGRWDDVSATFDRHQDGLLFQPFIAPAPKADYTVLSALEAASMARFEHGESGAR